MAKKYYAVKVGVTPGVYESWDECKMQVSGFSGATYKSFKTRVEAEQFVTGDTSNNGKVDSLVDAKKKNLCEQRQENENQIRFTAYVDGSYNSSTKEYSYGMIILDGDEVVLTDSKKFDDDQLSQMNNVAGELEGSMAAMQYAVDHELKAIRIVYDYEGIAKWCLGEWKTNKAGTKRYKQFYDTISKDVVVQFVKVKGHSNDTYNDMADALAKEAVGIEA